MLNGRSSRLRIRIIIIRLTRMIRHVKGVSLEVSLFALGFIAAALVAYEVDLFGTKGHGKGIDLDEGLLLGMVFALGMFVFSVRRLIEHKRELRLRIAAEQRATALALQDPLTALANRRQFDEALAATVYMSPAAGTSHAVFLLDLNDFKSINDVHGHGAGDRILVAVAQRLRGAVRSRHLVARLGGDEFAVLATHLAGTESAASIAARVTDVFCQPVIVDGIEHHVCAAIGISLLPLNARTSSEALRMADVALYRAKRERRTVACFFEPGIDKHGFKLTGAERTVETHLRRAP